MDAMPFYPSVPYYTNFIQKQQKILNGNLKTGAHEDHLLKEP